MYKISNQTKERYSSIAIVLIIFILTSSSAYCQVSLLKSLPQSQRYIALYQTKALQNTAEKSKLSLDSVVQFAKATEDPFLSSEAYIFRAKYAALSVPSANQKLAFFKETWEQIKDYENDEIKGF